MRRLFSKLLLVGWFGLATGQSIKGEQPQDQLEKVQIAAKGTGTDLFGDHLPAAAIARMGTLRFRHGARVEAVAFSPDGRTLASAGEDAVIRLWDKATGRQIRMFQGHEDYAKAVA